MADRLIHLPIEEARTAERQRGRDLRDLWERTRAIYRAAAGTSDEDGIRGEGAG